MANSSLNSTGDAEMSEECDGDKVVTMMDVLQEQQDFEEDANAVLGASDDKNCTYSKGYVKRQAIYACLTCCSEARFDPTKRAGVCLACSLNCHENHELIELYTKRNFCCDCGNSKFNSNPCQFTSDKTDLNEDNVYNQNFSGLYCTCHRPYPDPDGFEDEMIQCIICEDWLHAQHLEATVPSQDQYAEMICKDCMDKNEFLHDYSELAVNNEEDVDVVNNSINNVSMNGCQLQIKVNGYDENKKHENDTQLKNDSKQNGTDMIEKTDQPISEPSLENETLKTNDQSEEAAEQITEEKTGTEISEAPTDQTESKTDNAEAGNAGIKELDKENSENTNVEAESTESSIETEVKVSENKAQTDAANECNVLDDINKLLAGDDDEIKEDGKDKPIQEQNEETAIPTSEKENKMNNSSIDEDKKVVIEHIQEDESQIAKNKTDDSLADIGHNKDSETNSTNDDVTNTVNDNDIKDQGDNLESDKQEGDNLVMDKQEDNLEMDKQEEDNLVMDKQEDNLEMDKQEEDNLEMDKQEGDNLEKKDKQEANDIEKLENYVTENDKIEEENTELAIEKEASEIKPTSTDVTGMETDQLKEVSSENGLILNGHSEQKENKRKLSTENTEDNEVTMKKSKFDICSRPKTRKKVFTGATFWPHNFRQQLCTCSECMTMYKDLSVLYLTDLEDTVTAYETLGKENGSTTQYERGMEALSSLGRIQQINALTEYNKMRDKLVDFLRSFKERREVVKEEDIKAFFAGMKPTRESDGVYFCR